MALGKPLRHLLLRGRLLLPRHFSSAVESHETDLQTSVRLAIESKNYSHIPQLLHSHSHLAPDPDVNPNPNPNPFIFFSLLPPPLAAAIALDFFPYLSTLRPRSILSPVFSSLLSLFLPLPRLLPLSLATLYTSFLCGHSPPVFSASPLSLSYLHLRRSRRLRPEAILSSPLTYGFPIDILTSNFLLSSLCSINSYETDEAIALLRAMPAAGVQPDKESYCTVIETANWSDAEKLLREMVAENGMAPRRGTVGRVVRKMRAEREVRRAAELVRFLEREGFAVAFDGYEEVVEGFLEEGEVVAGARVMAEMADRGFVPYARVRRKMEERLVMLGQAELAAEVRQRLVGNRSWR